MNDCAYAQSDVAAPSDVTTVTQTAMPEAWWTGSVISNSAATLPHGRGLVETYLCDKVGRCGEEAKRQACGH